MKESLRDRLVREEGIKLFPYKDSKGIITIGIGHNIEADPIMFKNLEILKSRGITKEEAYGLLDKDIREHTALLVEALPWVGDLDWNRKSVLIDLAFNMGIKTLLTFNNTLEHIKQGNWKDAGDHLKASKWYEQVGPNRADLLIKILVTGDD
jgi:lysozyme